MLTYTFSQANLGKMAFVVSITAARVLHVTLRSEKTEKANSFQSIRIDHRW
jgi:hypothetical protein